MTFIFPKMEEVEAGSWMEWWPMVAHLTVILNSPDASNGHISSYSQSLMQLSVIRWSSFLDDIIETIICHSSGGNPHLKADCR